MSFGSGAFVPFELNAMITGQIEDPQLVPDGSDVVFGDKRHWHEISLVRCFASKVHGSNFERPN